jgi:hypothetical protein
MPAWIHDRAEHIRSKNPDMPESESWAIATQQSHALGKTPKSYGTLKGREVAKAKFKTPGDDVKTAGLGQVLTTPIPGTPKLLSGGVVDSFRKAIGGRPSSEVTKQKAKALGREFMNQQWKTSSITLGAFLDELEKIALNPKVEASAAVRGILRKASKSGQLDKVQNTGAWKQLTYHAANPSPEHSTIFRKLHSRLGNYINEGASS